MVGGGSRRDEGSMVINNTNVFAALETLRKKKKSDKDRGSSKKSSSKCQQSQPQKEPEPQVFWAPAPLNVKSWADVDDDDDYYATTAPPQSVWGSSEPSHEDKTVNEENANFSDCITKKAIMLAKVKRYSVLSFSMDEDSESEEDILDEGDDDIEEDHDHEPEVPVHPEPLPKRVPEVPLPSKEPERQLSKKERKKKELAELEALLADFGVTQKESNGQDESRGNLTNLVQHFAPSFCGKSLMIQDVSWDTMHNNLKAVHVAQEKKDGEGEKKENPPGESKSAKKKKKKDKSKEGKESQDQLTITDATNGPDEAAGTEQNEEDASAVDVKERLKKMASMKKKKSSKEMDAAAKAAAQEAAARSARLAAAKKKEKNHYNQQPVR
ncbi:hypothetical protein Gohar_022501 [Gossypium harknessii]|uniref:Uncharacterized protein n=1 Tax=Gossypium harknessii TaxID=34285 RepID=A0A7J9HA52_9ROSI|nr:hypothetical protein [Gossypium harknessii]